MINCIWLVAVAAVASLAGAPASAAVLVTIEQVGDDVVESAFGSLDVSALVGSFSPGTAATQSYTQGSTGNLIMGPDTDTSADPADHATTYYRLAGDPNAIVGPANFGTGLAAIAPTSVSGDPFGTVKITIPNARYLIVPHGYVSGATIQSGAVFANQTFASLGLTPGTYVYSWPTDSITISIGGVRADVPEPTTWAMMILGFGVAGVGLRRRRASALNAQG